MTTLARRLEQVAAGLSPTEAVVQWLEEAKGYGGYAAALEAIKVDTLRNPFLSLPLLVVGARAKGTTEETERAIRSTIVRLMLVEQQNRLLALG